MRWQPHNYQKKAMRFGVQRAHAGFFQDPGLGKTAEMLGLFKSLRRAGLVKSMLVIAPLRPATLVWPAELEKWDDFRELNLHVLHGPDKQRLLETPHDISVINPEGLPWLLGFREERRTHPSAARKAGVKWDMLVVDESTQFKHSTTQRFRVLRPWLPSFKRRYILTGDPAPNGMMDLHGQAFLLDLGKALGPYITHFRSKYFNPTGFGGYSWEIKPGADQKIYKALSPFVLRMAAEDYLELPPLVINDVLVELPKKARKIYNQMEKLLIAQLEGGIITAANAGVSISKCRQIAGGAVFTDSDGAYELIHDAKIEAAQSLVEERMGRPVLIAYEFQHNLIQLQKAFPQAPHIGGGVSTKRAREVERMWNAGCLPVLLAQSQSVARGLNLQGTEASIIFYTLPWDLEVYKQFIRRSWRQGQKSRVVVHRLLAAKTVDLAVAEALRSKHYVQQALFEALQRLARSRA